MKPWYAYLTILIPFVSMGIYLWVARRDDLRWEREIKERLGLNNDTFLNEQPHRGARFTPEGGFYYDE